MATNCLASSVLPASIKKCAMPQMGSRSSALDQVEFFLPRDDVLISFISHDGVLFRAGEVTRMGVGEMVVDSSEIINTLRGGGITSVGYAVSEVISKHTKKKRGIFGGIKDKFAKRGQPRKSCLAKTNLQNLLLLSAVPCSGDSQCRVTTLPRNGRWCSL
jgi:hypothetical protein